MKKYRFTIEVTSWEKEALRRTLGSLERSYKEQLVLDDMEISKIESGAKKILCNLDTLRDLLIKLVGEGE